MTRLWDIPYLLFIIWICITHARIFARNKPIGPLFHIFWAGIYMIPVIPIAVFCHNWLIVCAVILERLVFFNPILNLIRDKPFFYQGSQVLNHAITNTLYTPLSWLLAVGGFIAIQFIL